MAYSIAELRAIQWHMERTNSIPQLSTRPMVRFMERGTGEITEQHIITLKTQHQAAMKDEAKERKRQNRGKKK